MYIIESTYCPMVNIGHQPTKRYTCNDCKDVVDILVGIVGVSKGALTAFDSKLLERLMDMEFGEKYGPVYWNSYYITISCVPDEDEEVDIPAPCPFCGHEPEMDFLYYGYGCGGNRNKPVVRWRIYCHDCGCYIDPEDTVYELNVKTGKMDICGEDGRLKMIRKWNRSARRF